ncbi:MAG: hypothetical protein JWQ87_2016 [Candidatus Sulfotelmatobacter sp.]|nr:hypothetical protein [Candidatus Sulfotelmatobacter sp.]
MPAIETRVTTAKEIAPDQARQIVVAPPALAGARPNFWGLLPTQDMPDANVHNGPSRSPVFVPNFANSDENLSDSQTTSTALIASIQSRTAPPSVGYVPRVTANSGTFTAASALGYYTTVGKLVWVFFQVTITTAGTGANPVVTLPLPTRFSAVLVGCEEALNGIAVTVQLGWFTNQDSVMRNADNTNPAVDGAVIRVSGVYETI